MRPRRLVNKAEQKLRCCDGPSIAPTGVLHVGEFRFDLLVVFGSERHPPHPLISRLPRPDQPLSEPIVIREEPSVLMAERNDDRSGERSEVDHKLGLEALVHVM